MKYYRATEGPVKIGSDVEMELGEAQHNDRRNSVSPRKATAEAGVYTTERPLMFKQGEVFGMAGDAPRTVTRVCETVSPQEFARIKADREYAVAEKQAERAAGDAAARKAEAEMIDLNLESAEKRLKNAQKAVDDAKAAAEKARQDAEKAEQRSAKPKARASA